MVGSLAFLLLLLHIVSGYVAVFNSSVVSSCRDTPCDFSSPSIWNGGTAPLNGDDVYINYGLNQVEALLVINTPITINNFFMGGPIRLTLAALLTVSGSFSMTNGSYVVTQNAQLNVQVSSCVFYVGTSSSFYADSAGNSIYKSGNSFIFEGASSVQGSLGSTCANIIFQSGRVDLSKTIIYGNVTLANNLFLYGGGLTIYGSLFYNTNLNIIPDQNNKIAQINVSGPIEFVFEDAHYLQLDFVSYFMASYIRIENAIVPLSCTDSTAITIKAQTLQFINSEVNLCREMTITGTLELTSSRLFMRNYYGSTINVGGNLKIDKYSNLTSIDSAPALTVAQTCVLGGNLTFTTTYNDSRYTVLECGSINGVFDFAIAQPNTYYISYSATAIYAISDSVKRKIHEIILPIVFGVLFVGGLVIGLVFVRCNKSKFSKL